MKKYNITVNGNTYEVFVEEAGSVSAPVYTAPVAPVTPVAPVAPVAPAPSVSLLYPQGDFSQLKS